MLSDDDGTALGHLRPEFDGVILEWKPFSVQPILVYPLLCKQDKLLFCFACSLFHILRFSWEPTVDSLCVWKTYAWGEIEWNKRGAQMQCGEREREGINKTKLGT